MKVERKWGGSQEYVFSGIGLVIGIIFRVLGVIFEFANIELLLDGFHERQVRLLSIFFSIIRGDKLRENVPVCAF